jgi:hypothetical protein
MVQIPGVFHQWRNRFFINVKPPVLSANFFTYDCPLMTRTRAKILAPNTTTLCSGSASRYRSHFPVTFLAKRTTS